VGYTAKSRGWKGYWIIRFMGLHQDKSIIAFFLVLDLKRWWGFVSRKNPPGFTQTISMK
jgi:hypothetical protein